jgi:hypothetical protein
LMRSPIMTKRSSKPILTSLLAELISVVVILYLSVLLALTRKGHHVGPCLMPG